MITKGLAMDLAAVRSGARGTRHPLCNGAARAGCARHRPHGFTLIEVMVVVVILGILAAIVVPRIMSRPDEARVVKAQQDLRAIGAALDLYKLDNFNYPPTAQGLEALVTKPAVLPPGANWRSGGYLAKLPTDPWGAPYQYLAPGQHGEYDLYSLGADGTLGGDGNNRDLGNWDAE